jgi:hypothetical protein
LLQKRYLSRLNRDEFCCDHLYGVVTDGPFLAYDDEKREFLILRLYTESADRLDYCPWCATRMPASLDEARYAAVEKIIPNFDEFSTPRAQIPSALRSSAWWKREKL